MSDSRWEKVFTAAYRFMRVSCLTGTEVEQLDNISSGGSITRNPSTDYYETASATFYGDLDVGADYIRIYLDAEFEDGTSISEPLGTYLAEVPSRDISSGEISGAVKLYGLLKTVKTAEFPAPRTISKGTSVVTAAAKILEEVGLTVVADDSSYTLSQDWTMGMVGGTDNSDSPQTRLEAVNALLDLAGFSACQTDPMGRVVMRKYKNPSDSSSVFSFAQGENARYLDSATYDRDKNEVANAVKCVYSNDSGCVIGTAYDRDRGSETSIPNIGYERWARYDYDDLVSQADANAKAEQLLKTQRSIIRRVEMEHIYMPLYPGDVVELRGLDEIAHGKYSIRTQDIKLVGGCPITAELRAYDRY